MLRSLLALCLFLSFFSCEKEAIAPSVPIVEQTTDGTTTLVVTLLYIEHTGQSGGCETYVEYPLVNHELSLFAVHGAGKEVVSSLRTDRDGQVSFSSFDKGPEYQVSTTYPDGEIINRSVTIREGHTSYLQITH